VTAFLALLAAVVLALAGAAALAACGVLTMTLRRPSGAARRAWREGGR
jgi:hypothetical protein